MQSKRFQTLVVTLALAALALSAVGCQKLKARDELNKGVNAYKASQYEQAIEHFKRAKELDPDLLNARLYLATAYASMYIPGAPSPENIRNAEQAIAEFKQVLEVDPNNLSAIDGIGSLLFQMGGTPYEPEKFRESRDYHLRHIELSPTDTEPYYWVGVINWTLAFRANRELRANYNSQNPRRQVKDDEPLPPPVRAEFVEKYGQTVDEGIRLLEKALELNPDYEDAVAYLNLLYRQKADMAAGSEERNRFIAMADELVDRHKEIRQRKQAHAPTG
jgi:tetratricopeptide (TPR) repeat protein